MLEFYYKFYPAKFEKKVIALTEELGRILWLEQVEVIPTTSFAIEECYQASLTQSTFQQINNLYHTIRVTGLSKHFLLKKYLPEYRQEPSNDELCFADFFAGAGGLSLGLTQAGFTPAFVNDDQIDAIG